MFTVPAASSSSLRWPGTRMTPGLHLVDHMQDHPNLGTIVVKSEYHADAHLQAGERDELHMRRQSLPGGGGLVGVEAASWQLLNKRNRPLHSSWPPFFGGTSSTCFRSFLAFAKR
jgi:hypothetical protein